MYVLKKQEGGRHTPFVANYQPQLFARTGTVTAAVVLPDGKEMVMPGEDTKLTLTLNKTFPIENNQRFTLREGHITIGTGVVTKILN